MNVVYTGSVRVLVVDDSPRTAALFTRIFGGEGYAVDVVANGPDALCRTMELAYDAVVVGADNSTSPGMSGIELCQRLRSERIETSILMIATRGDESDECAALNAGADDYLVKPLSDAVLLARMGAVLRRGAHHDRSVVLDLGDLRLDLAAKRVWRGEVEVHLTVREREVLELLLRRRDHVVSQQEILRHVWGDAFAGDMNVVAVYIRLLRAKIDRPFARDTIRTYRGAGYRLVDCWAE